MGTWTINPDDLGATRTGLGLGTAATVNTGTTNGNVPLVGADGKLAGAVLPPSGGSIDLTASGAITAGKAVLLNANGTVSEIVGTSITQLIGSAFTPTNETASDAGRIAYMTVPNKFFLLQKSTVSGSNVLRARVLDLSTSMAITETTNAAISGSLQPYSADYSETHDRVILQGQNSSPYYPGIYTASYSVANGLDVDGVTNAASSNMAYGASVFIGDNDHAICTTYPLTGTPASLFYRFFGLTLGSDASGDSLSSPQDYNAGITTGGETYHYYISPIWFSGPSKLMILKHGYHAASDYRVRLGYGSISGTGSATTYTEEGEADWNDSDMFMNSGKVRYDAGLDRAVWFDGKFLRTISLTGGYSQSALATVQASYPGTSNPTAACAVIPGTNLVGCFGPDAANSNRFTMWLVTITTGSNAAADTFSVASAVEISTDVASHYNDVRWSPDAGGFLTYLYMPAASVSFGVRPARTSTNVTSSNFLGFAAASAGDGATVSVQLPGATATPAGGGLTAGTTYYVSSGGGVQTTDAGFGKAGRAISSTQLIIEERS
ncbi:MAG: hypothetical protein P8R39_12245 [Alphaproteobacteria bacterium]|nr:hypothetical protein [Alphaproteobacteria bacterium]